MLYVDYRSAISNPEAEASRVSAFLGGGLDALGGDHQAGGPIGGDYATTPTDNSYRYVELAAAPAVDTVAPLTASSAAATCSSSGWQASR